jgi:hypothetical protein
MLVARDAKEPAGQVLDRHQQAIGLHQLVEDLLHDVLRVGGIGHAAADEVAQPGTLSREGLGESTVLLAHRHGARRLVHSSL